MTWAFAFIQPRASTLESSRQTSSCRARVSTPYRSSSEAPRRARKGPYRGAAEKPPDVRLGSRGAKRQEVQEHRRAAGVRRRRSGDPSAAKTRPKFLLEIGVGRALRPAVVPELLDRVAA